MAYPYTLTGTDGGAMTTGGYTGLSALGAGLSTGVWASDHC